MDGGSHCEELTKRMDPDLPYYYHTSTHNRFYEGKLPKFDEPAHRTKKQQRPPRRASKWHCGRQSYIGTTWVCVYKKSHPCGPTTTSSQGGGGGGGGGTWAGSTYGMGYYKRPYQLISQTWVEKKRDQVGRQIKGGKGEYH